MASASFNTRVVVLVMGGAFATAAVQPASAQRDGERSGERVQPPTELLEEYPFRQGRLRSRERPDAVKRPSDAKVAPEERPSESNPVEFIASGILGATIVLLLVTLGLRARRRTVGGLGQERPPSRTRSARFAARRGPGNSYAVVNQKGGVGKTTISLTLGAAAVRRGHSVLLVDLDPQASATSVLGADVGDGPTMSDVMVHADCALEEAVRPTDWGLSVAPADRELRAADSGDTTTYEAVLPRQLARAGEYDLLLIDCPPNLGTLTIDALAATSHALVVTEPTALALHAMEELLDTLRDVAAECNPSLELAGVVLNRLEATAEHRHSLAELQDMFGSRLWLPPVPKRAILQDAMRQGRPAQDLQSHSHYATEIAEIFDALALRVEATQVKS
jgi:chromosome partitioning protein